MQHKRKRFWVDRFQTFLFIRLVSYVVVYSTIIAVFFVFWNWFCQFGSGEMRPLEWRDFVPALIGSLLLLPAMVWDMLKLSHRFVGPLVRFRRALKDIADGVNIDPIKLRDGDFLQDFKDDFNHMLAALKESDYFEEQPAKETGSREVIHV